MSSVRASCHLIGELNQCCDVIEMILNQAGQKEQVVLIHR